MTSIAANRKLGKLGVGNELKNWWKDQDVVDPFELLSAIGDIGKLISFTDL